MKRSIRDCSSTKRAGFVLIVVLALIVVVAFSAAGMARRSLQLAMEGAALQNDLQRRWAVRSLQRVVLGRAEALLNQAQPEQGSVAAPHRRSFRIRLGDAEYDLVLADEDSKANLNSLYYRTGRAETAQIIRELQSGSSGLAVRIRPFEASDLGETLPVFDTWGQVFDLATSHDSPAALEQSTSNITCWGEGRLNVRRASDPVLREVCAAYSSAAAADSLVAARHSHPSPTVEELLGNVNLEFAERSALSGVLSERSNCHSLWIRSPELGWRSLHIIERLERGRTYHLTFLW